MRYAQMLGLGIQPYFTPNSTYVFAGGDSSPILLPASPNGMTSTPGLLNLPGLGDALRRYTNHYKRLTPTLRLLGGLPVILKAAPGLSAPMDRWMADIGAAALLPIAAQVMLQTGYGHLSQTTAAACLLYLTPLYMVRPRPWLGVQPCWCSELSMTLMPHSCPCLARIFCGTKPARTRAPIPLGRMRLPMMWALLKYCNA